MAELTSMMNIGKEMSKKLSSVGIDCAEELIYVGAKQAFQRLKVAYPNVGAGVIVTILSLCGITVNGTWFFTGLLTAGIIYTLLFMLRHQINKFIITICFAVVSVLFLFSVNYVYGNVLQPHQQMRIKVLLGIEENLRGAGYNVNQSKIAIGSGGLIGKGFLNGTQTKLKYVPEQHTDFIFRVNRISSCRHPVHQIDY